MTWKTVPSTCPESIRGRIWGCWFFFSSRRRHTSWPRDWSSDVCSSDLADVVQQGAPAERRQRLHREAHLLGQSSGVVGNAQGMSLGLVVASVEGAGKRLQSRPVRFLELSQRLDRKSVVEGKGVERCASR